MKLKGKFLYQFRTFSPRLVSDDSGEYMYVHVRDVCNIDC